LGREISRKRWLIGNIVSYIRLRNMKVAVKRKCKDIINKMTGCYMSIDKYHKQNVLQRVFQGMIRFGEEDFLGRADYDMNDIV